MLITLLPFMLAWLASLTALPTIIKIGYSKHLLDDPTSESRKIHHHSVPNLGGVVVFSIFILVSCLLINSDLLPKANFILAAAIIIFAIGLKDDLLALNPYKKFIAQFCAAFIVMYFADIKITHFYGVMGINEIGPALSYIFTSFVIVFIINAFNLIDGINGLLGAEALLCSIIYGILFYLMNEKGLCIASFTLAGSIAGFLKYNFKNRARIFMGDAGAYTVGFVLVLLSIQFVELNQVKNVSYIDPFIHAAPGVAIAILIMPIFDTFRVFTLRIIRGQSPFIADRNHLHHRLLDIGMNHLQATATIVTTNILMIGLALSIHKQVQTSELLAIVTLATLFCNTLLWIYEINYANKPSRTHVGTLLKQRLTNELEQANINVDSHIIIVAPDKDAIIANQDDYQQATKRLTQEILDNLEKSKN